MDSKYLVDKVDSISEDISEIKVIMARNTASLEEHMRRTALAEQQIASLREDLLPVEDHVKQVRWTAKAIVWLAVSIGGLVAFSNDLLTFIRNLLR